MLVFCVVTALVFQAYSLLNLRKGFYVYLASLPLLPAYIAIPLVKGGAGISLSRLLTYALAVALIVSIARNTRTWANVFKTIGQWPAFIFWGICLYIAKLVSTAMNRDAVILFYWLDEFVGALVVFLLAVRYFSRMEDIKKLFYMLISVLVVQAGIVFVESLSNQPILHGIVEINVSTVGDKISQGFERAGAYRAVGLFDNPLSLAEYFLIGASMLFGSYWLSARKRPLLLLGALAVLGSAIMMTGARFSVITFALAFITAGLFFHGYRLAAYSRPIFLAFTALLFSMLGYFAFQAITDVYWFIEILNTYFPEDMSGTASVVSRASQYLIVPAEIMGNASYGFWGEGIRSDLIERLDLRLDNYYLRVLIEGGLSGLISFVALLFLAFKRSVLPLNYRYLPTHAAKGLRFFLLLFFAAFAINKFFLSMSFNNQYFFLFAGVSLTLLAHRSTTQKHGDRLAHSART
jgi:hypothetical protein